MKSKFLSLNISDFTKSLLMVIFGSITAVLLQIIELKGLHLNTIDFLEILRAGIIAGLGYLIKNFFETEDGEQLGGVIKKFK